MGRLKIKEDTIGNIVGKTILPWWQQRIMDEQGLINMDSMKTYVPILPSVHVDEFARKIKDFHPQLVFKFYKKENPIKVVGLPPIYGGHKVYFPMFDKETGKIELQKIAIVGEAGNPWIHPIGKKASYIKQNGEIDLYKTHVGWQQALSQIMDFFEKNHIRINLDSLKDKNLIRL